MQVTCEQLLLGNTVLLSVMSCNWDWILAWLLHRSQLSASRLASLWKESCAEGLLQWSQLRGSLWFLMSISSMSVPLHAAQRAESCVMPFA